MLCVLLKGNSTKEIRGKETLKNVTDKMQGEWFDIVMDSVV